MSMRVVVVVVVIAISRQSVIVILLRGSRSSDRSLSLGMLMSYVIWMLLLVLHLLLV